MRVSRIAVTRSAKINTGNYENTDVTVSLEAELDVGEDASASCTRLMGMADDMLGDKIDEIELGERKAKSKAVRFIGSK